jgi:hypothetical protein
VILELIKKVVKEDKAVSTKMVAGQEYMSFTVVLEIVYNSG